MRKEGSVSITPAIDTPCFQGPGGRVGYAVWTQSNPTTYLLILICLISVAVKTPPKEDSLFLNEVDTYAYKSISVSPHIRALREYVNTESDHFLVFEWMEKTLWDTKNESVEAKLKVFKPIVRSSLKGLIAFENPDGFGPHCHTDLSPENILIAGFRDPEPVVKLADLGWSGYLFHFLKRTCLITMTSTLTG